MLLLHWKGSEGLQTVNLSGFSIVCYMYVNIHKHQEQVGYGYFRLGFYQLTFCI